jgi:toxin ParE1/3/4
MEIRWSPAAAEDLFRIIEYVRQENPSAAQRIAKTIYESTDSLKSFPYRGRAGRVEGTRRCRFWWFTGCSTRQWKLPM